MSHQKTPSSLSSSARVDRALPIPGLLLTSTVVFTLLGLKLRGWRGSDGFADFITNDRTTVAIAVRIISHVLYLLPLGVCSVNMVFQVDLRRSEIHLVHIVTV